MVIRINFEKKNVKRIYEWFFSNIWFGKNIEIIIIICIWSYYCLCGNLNGNIKVFINIFLWKLLSLMCVCLREMFI